MSDFSVCWLEFTLKSTVIKLNQGFIPQNLSLFRFSSPNVNFCIRLPKSTSFITSHASIRLCFRILTCYLPIRRSKSSISCITVYPPIEITKDKNLDRCWVNILSSKWSFRVFEISHPL